MEKIHLVGHPSSTTVKSNVFQNKILYNFFLITEFYGLNMRFYKNDFHQTTATRIRCII